MTTPPSSDSESASYNRQVGLAVGLTAGLLVVTGLTVGIVASSAPSDDEGRAPPGTTAVELDRLRDRQLTELTTTDWVDPNGGRLRIPVERAIDKLSDELIESDYGQAGKPKPVKPEPVKPKTEQHKPEKPSSTAEGR